MLSITKAVRFIARMIAAAGGLVCGFSHPAHAAVSDAAFALIAERVAADRASFFVYVDADSGFNHGFPSGLFGAIDKIHLDPACLDDPSSANGCSTAASRMDTARGTVLRITFDPLSPGEFAGVNIEEPQDWGALHSGVGYDLRGASNLVFDVRSPDGARVRFGVSGGNTEFIELPQTWTTKSIPLSSLGVASADLGSVHVLFTVVTNDANASGGGTVLLDNIHLDPAPASQQSAVSFPLANQTFGVVPASTAASGRVPIPPDQLLRNVTTTYESALALLALLRRGDDDALAQARFIADAFDYALHHDNIGDPLPAAGDGSRGLHNAYESGDLELLNDQRPGAGQRGNVRLAGFSASTNLCGPAGFCLVLDGATGGNNAFAILALAAAYRQFNDQRYLDDARTIGRWIVAKLANPDATGYAGYFLGYPDEGKPKDLLKSKSIENNADIFAGFTELAAIERQVGNDAEAAAWTSHARLAGDFVMAMFDDDSGCFAAGTVPPGTPEQAGTTPAGPQRGNDIINTFDFLDSNTFTTLALAAAPDYRNRIDWRRPIQCAVNKFRQSVTAGGRQFDGFDIVRTPTAGPNGVAWEFTGQAIVAMRFVDRLYRECRFEADAAAYVEQIRQAQRAAPFRDGRGLVAGTLQDGDLIQPGEQCLSTPFQCIAERVGLAATTWAIFSEQDVNPLAPIGASCAGNCNGDDAVTVDEILMMVSIALGHTERCACLAGDRDANGVISVEEIVAAVNGALHGCGNQEAPSHRTLDR